MIKQYPMTKQYEIIPFLCTYLEKYIHMSVGKKCKRKLMTALISTFAIAETNSTTHQEDRILG
jgi:hypothetical protein